MALVLRSASHACASARPCAARVGSSLSQRRPRPSESTAKTHAQPSRSAVSRRASVTTAAAGAEAEAAPAARVEPSVGEVMNPRPVLLRSDMPIKEAVQLMLDRDVSGAPVVDEEGRLVGVLSEADLIWKGAGAPQDHFIIPPVFLGFADMMLYLRDNKAFEEDVHKLLARTVREAMSDHDLATTTPDSPMSEAAKTMLAKDINLLPVVEEGRVVGIITRHDVLRGIYASHSPFL